MFSTSYLLMLKIFIGDPTFYVEASSVWKNRLEGESSYSLICYIYIYRERDSVDLVGKIMKRGQKKCRH